MAKKTKMPSMAGSDAKSLAQTVPAPMSKDPDMMDHETRGHMQTIMDAHEIMQNPDKMAKVKKMVGRHKQAITSLSQLKDVANNYSKNNPEDGEE